MNQVEKSPQTRAGIGKKKKKQFYILMKLSDINKFCRENLEYGLRREGQGGLLAS